MAEFHKILKADGGFESIQKYNKNHGADGRFSSAGAGGGGGGGGGGDGSDKTNDAPTDTDLNNDGFRVGEPYVSH